MADGNIVKKNMAQIIEGSLKYSLWNLKHNDGKYITIPIKSGKGTVGIQNIR